MTTSSKKLGKKLKIIGLSGTNGSGKDAAGHILAEYHGYLFVPVTELLRVELRRRRLPVSRENLRMVGSEWRHELGLGVLADKAVADYRVAEDQYKGVVISSLRNPGEADRIHNLGGTVVWIDADQLIRYKRVQANAVSRGRAEEDNKTFEQFQVEESIEMDLPKDADDTSLNMNAVKERADILLDNSDQDLAAFKIALGEALGL
jgi:dephospho-CoA kinase